MVIKINEEFLYRKEPFGGISFLKKTEDYFYLKPEMIDILNFIKRKGEIEVGTVCKKFKISQETIFKWIKIGILNLVSPERTQ